MDTDLKKEILQFIIPFLNISCKSHICLVRLHLYSHCVRTKETISNNNNGTSNSFILKNILQISAFCVKKGFDIHSNGNIHQDYKRQTPLVMLEKYCKPLGMSNLTVYCRKSKTSHV